MDNFKEIIVGDDNGEKRLDVFIVDSINELTRSQAQKLIKNQDVLVNGVVEKSSYIVNSGDKINIKTNCDKNNIKAQNIALNIVFEDDNVIVINKQKGLLVHPTPNQLEDTLVNALIYHCGNNLSDINGDYMRRGIVHRLDKNTAGLMLVAKTNEAHLHLAEQIKNKTAIRKYRAIVYGEMDKDFGIIDIPLKRSIKDNVKFVRADINDDGAKKAITLYKVIERFNGATYLELELKTGRTHQIRAHMSILNHPVVGDTLYGSRGFKHKILDKIKTNEQVLQSYYLKFIHPISCDTMEFELMENEWDKDILNVLKKLREGKNG